MGYQLEIFLAVICFVILCRTFRHKINKFPWNWPLVGTLPMVFLNFNRLYDKLAEILQQSNDMTFLLKGPWFACMDLIITSNPANVHHIMNKNFANYPKGSESREIFDFLGDSLFNEDDLVLWREQRKMVHAFFNDQRFHKFTPKINQHILEKGLIPVLDHASKHGTVVDLQDLVQRCMFDATCMMITGYDPASLRISLPEVPFSKAMDDATGAILLRHMLPQRLWKLQRWLGVGTERKMREAMETLDHIAANYISMKRRELNGTDEEEGGFDALKCCLNEDEMFGSSMNTDNAMRECIIGLMFAGRDTAGSVMAWFFWLLMKNPLVETKIRDELIKDNLEAEKFGLVNVENLNKLVYLHAALCETLRLFPPVPTQSRVPIEPDILPTGHHVNPKKTIVVISSYVMGRMKSIWGEDCLEFKPERWVLEKGEGIKMEPSKKFFAFSSGPRTCPGKELSFIRMKAVAAAIIHNYHLQPVAGHPVTPAISIIHHMKHGLKVRVTNRWA